VRYPNGLQCAVSPKRAAAYEAIVPPIALFSIIVGWLVLGGKVTRWVAPPEWYVVVFPLLGLLWAMACVLGAYGVFCLWCKPVG
jgi:hypothetical protein